jgi:hypothetical protein
LAIHLAGDSIDGEIGYRAVQILGAVYAAGFGSAIYENESLGESSPRP